MNTSWRFFDMPCHDKAAQCLFQLFVVELSMSHNICHGYWHVSYDMFHIPYNPCNVIWHEAWHCHMTGHVTCDMTCQMSHDMNICHVTWRMTYDICHVSWHITCQMIANDICHVRWHMTCQMKWYMASLRFKHESLHCKPHYKLDNSCYHTSTGTST